jgi:UDP-glucose 4-epimerase
MNPPHIVVTGGAGFIGSHLVERLLSQGKRLVVIDDLSTGSLENLNRYRNHPNLRILQHTVTACPGLDELVKEAECIYHLAAAVGVELVVKSPIFTIRTNLQETEAILEAASRYGVRTLITSSSEVYGKSAKELFAENDDLLIGPPNLGRWSYACSKLMDEFLALAFARERSLPVVLVRLFNIVGPRQTGRYGMVLPRFIASAKQNLPIQVFGDGRQTRCFCLVHDAVEALIRLQACPEACGEVFNVGSDEEISILDLARLVVEQLNATSIIQFLPYQVAYAPGFEDMLRRKPNLTKLAQTTGFRPSTPLKAIIEATIRQDSVS